MKIVNMDRLVKLRKDTEFSSMGMVEVAETKTTEVDHDESADRRERYMNIKDYIESHMQGIEVFVSGGEVTYIHPENFYKKEKPVVITTYRTGVKNTYTNVTLAASIYDDNYESKIYDSYIHSLLDNDCVVQKFVSNIEIFLEDTLYETCFTECGFNVHDNKLLLFKNEKVYTVIEDIAKDVQGIVQVFLPDDRDCSLLIVCDNRDILLSDDNFYIDVQECEVA